MELLAWRFRFENFFSRENPLVEALQRMQAKLLEQEPSSWDGAFCEDDCGKIERLRHWGAVQEGIHNLSRIQWRACKGSSRPGENLAMLMPSMLKLPRRSRAVAVAAQQHDEQWLFLSASPRNGASIHGQCLDRRAPT